MFGLTTVDLIFFGTGIFFLAVWLFFYLLGLKYNQYFGALDEKEFRLKEIYGLGFAVLQLFRYDFKSKRDRDQRQRLEVLYGAKYCDYFLRVFRAEQITLTMTVLVVAFAVYGLTAEPAAPIIVAVMAGLVYYRVGETPKMKIDDRSAELLRDFCEVVSKMALMTNAGMILRDAWKLVASQGEGLFYREMNAAVSDMNNGYSDADAIYAFGSRCMIPEIKKFTSTVIQGLSKGPRDLAIMLQEQSAEVWMLKKQLVRREGERAASKLLIPICIMFMGIIIMIIVPIFSNLGVS